MLLHVIICRNIIDKKISLMKLFVGGGVGCNFWLTLDLERQLYPCFSLYVDLEVCGFGGGVVHDKLLKFLPMD